MTNKRERLLATTMIAGFALAGLAAPAMAQSQTAEEQTTQVGEIVVTGSRIARQDYQSTSPIVTVDT